MYIRSVILVPSFLPVEITDLAAFSLFPLSLSFSDQAESASAAHCILRNCVAPMYFMLIHLFGKDGCHSSFLGSFTLFVVFLGDG